MHTYWSVAKFFFEVQMPGTKWEKYEKKYNKAWEKEKGVKEWIQPIVGDDSKALCRLEYVSVKLRAHTMRTSYSMLAQTNIKMQHSSMRLTVIGFALSKQNESRQS